MTLYNWRLLILKQFKKILLMVMLIILYTFTNFEVYFNLSAKALFTQQWKWLIIDSLFAVLLFILMQMIYKKISQKNEAIPVKNKLLLTLIFMILALGINFMFSYLQTTANQQVLDTAATNTPILAAVQVRLFAPILEEFIFRGIFMNLFFTKNTNFSAFCSIFISGFLFGFLHTFHLDLALIMYSIIGWLLGSVYYYTKDIRCPIVIHLLLNNI